MPDNVEIQGLEFQIREDSDAAAKGLERLTNTLTALKSATKGGVSGLNSVAKQVEKLKNATAGIDNSAASRIKSFVSAIESTKKLSGVKISSTISKHLNTIREAAGSITSEHISNLNTLRDTLSGFTSIGKSNVGSMVNALAKLPAISEKMGSMDWKGFYSGIQRATRIVAPFAAEMEKIYNGFSVFPSKVQSFIKNSEKFNSAVDKSAKKASLFSGVTNKITFAGFLLALRYAKNAISDWITASNSYQENLNLFTVSMGEYAEQAYEYGERVSEVLGIDLSDWLRNQGVFNTLATGFGVVSDRAYIMSKNLTQLGYDLSSFFNISVEDAMEKLQSGISGELEPLRRLGYDLSDARLKATALALGIDKATNSMTQAEKAELRYYAIMSQVTTAQGDLARTIEAPANQLRILQAQFNAAARAAGNIFIPALNAILPYAVALLKGLRAVAESIASLFGFELTEVDYSGIGTVVGNVASDTGEIDSNLGGAAASAKELQRYLLGIDELNVLPDQSVGSGGSGGGIGGSSGGGGGFDFELPEYDFLGDAVAMRIDEVSKKIEPLIDFLKENTVDILEMVGLIGAGVLAWKLSNKLLSGVKNLVGYFKDGNNELDGWARAARIINGAIIVAVGLAWSYNVGYEIAKGQTSLTNMIGSVLGPIATGLGGALIGSAIVPGAGLGWGFAIGLTFGFVFEVIGAFKGRQEAMIDAFYQSDVGKQVQGLKSQIESQNQLALDLTARVDTITGAVDEKLLVDLQVAQQLVDDIFRMNAEDNKTATEIAIIQEKINALNGMGLEGIQLSFDTTTNQVIGTKEQINQTIDALLRQYQMEAMRDAYIEAYKAQFDAAQNLNDAIQTGSKLEEKHKSVADQLRDAKLLEAEAYRELSEWMQQTGFDISKPGSRGGLMDKYYELSGKVAEHRKRVEELSIEESELSGAMRDSRDTIQNSLTAFDNAREKVNFTTTSFEDLVRTMNNQVDPAFDSGANTAYGYGEGILSGSQEVQTSAVQLAQDMMKRFDATLGIHSPSTVFKEKGKYTVQGLANGIKENAYLVENAWKSMLNNMLSKMQLFINNSRNALNSMLRNFANSMNSVYVNGSSGKVSYNPPGYINVPQVMANGGFVDKGQLFVAREAGPELVGRIGSKTAVANQDQIVEAVAAGVYRAVSQAMGDGQTDIYLDGEKVFEVVKKQNNRERMRTGKNPLLV